MSSQPASGDASIEPPAHAYRLVSAAFQNKEYAEGVLWVNGTGSEMELRQWAGKKRKEETVIARFRLQPNVEVTVDGPLLRVSELSVTLESPAIAGEVADLLRQPARELETVRLVSEAEASVGGFLDSREEALNLISRIKVDPRRTLFEVGPVSAAAAADPLEAFYSSYSKRVEESLDKMKSSLAEGENVLGPAATERLYAVAYTIGAVQDAIFGGDSDLAQEAAALQELGIATTAQGIRTEQPLSRLLALAHPVLVSLAASRPRSS
jgi:hypothetical protein